MAPKKFDFHNKDFFALIGTLVVIFVAVLYVWGTAGVTTAKYFTAKDVYENLSKYKVGDRITIKDTISSLYIYPQPIYGFKGYVTFTSSLSVTIYSKADLTGLSEGVTVIAILEVQKLYGSTLPVIVYISKA